MVEPVFSIVEYMATEERNRSKTVNFIDNCKLETSTTG